MENAQIKLIGEKVVSEKTGFSLSKLRNDRAKGRGLPYVKINRMVKYIESDVDNFIKAHRVVPQN